MSDIFTKAKRSEVMSRIRSTGNRDTEVKLARLMRAAGITGWRRQIALRCHARGAERQELKVRADFVFRHKKVAVFVDGCFWHGCPRHGTRPQQNRAFWDAKLERNKVRDRAVTRGLKKAGWTVLRIWECALTVKRVPATMRRVEKAVSRQ